MLGAHVVTGYPVDLHWHPLVSVEWSIALGGAADVRLASTPTRLGRTHARRRHRSPLCPEHLNQLIHNRVLPKRPTRHRVLRSGAISKCQRSNVFNSTQNVTRMSIEEGGANPQPFPTLPGSTKNTTPFLLGARERKEVVWEVIHIMRGPCPSHGAEGQAVI